jgi:hypothetical protein
MRTTSIILFLIACTAHLSADGFSERKISDSKSYAGPKTAIPPANEDDELLFNNELLKKIMQERKAVSFILGKSAKDQNIEAWFFPGTSDKKALVIGGVHGSELSSIEVAQVLIQNLFQKEKMFYNVIIIPSLFPDNAQSAKEKNTKIGSTANIGRYSFPSAADPNRQMPTPGEPFYEGSGTDHLGRAIEKENKLLLQLIAIYKPERIASIHAIRDMTHAGIFADPRTDSDGCALGFESDSLLAIEMSGLIRNNNGYVPGNSLDKHPTALYYLDPEPAAKGEFQKRNFSGSSLPANRGSGISLGTWASTAITSATDPSYNRDAIRILTIEFPGYKRSLDYKSSKLRKYFRLQTELYAAAIEKIFLEEFYTEENENSLEPNVVSLQ